MLVCFCEEPMVIENESVNIFATKCGHVFHNSCLVQWIEKSESCPQCRSPVTENEIFRLYPALSEEGPDEDLQHILQTCLDELDDARTKVHEMTELCQEKDKLIAQLKVEAKKVKTAITTVTSNSSIKNMIAYVESGQRKLSKKKGGNFKKSRAVSLFSSTAQLISMKGVIANMHRNWATKGFSQENEALKSMLQILNGLKGMAAIICKTADSSVQEGSVELEMEPSGANAAQMQPRTESPDPNSVVTQRTETEAPDTEEDIVEVPSRTQPEPSDAEENIAEVPRRTQTSDDDAGTSQPSEDPSHANSLINDLETESPHANDEIESRAEISDAATTQATSRSHYIDDATTQSEIELGGTEAAASQHSQPSDNSSSVDDETAAIKSSLSTLEQLLIRISENKNNREQRMID